MTLGELFKKSLQNKSDVEGVYEIDMRLFNNEMWKLALQLFPDDALHRDLWVARVNKDIANAIYSGFMSRSAKMLVIREECSKNTYMPKMSFSVPPAPPVPCSKLATG